MKASKLIPFVVTVLFCVLLFGETKKFEEDTDYFQTALTIDTPINGKNTVYCITFQMVWDMLAKNESGFVELSPETPVATLLNTNRISGESFKYANPKDVSTSYIKNGYGFSIEAKIETKLRFEKHFQKIGYFPFNNGKGVRCFGIIPKTESDEEYSSDQVRILYYKNDGQYHDDEKTEFVVELETNSLNDELILALVEPENTLFETYEKVCDLICEYDPRGMSYEDSLIVPNIDLDIKRILGELHGREIKGMKGSITLAFQSIKLKLDEKGVEFKSIAKIISAVSASEPKRLIFNKPFLLFLRNKGKDLPYLIMWIQDDFMLVKPEN